MPRNPNFDYKFYKKTKLVNPNDEVDKSELTKVVAVLKGSKASVATKLAMEFEKVHLAKIELENEENKLKEKAIPYVQGLFDAEDEIMTRVLETSKVTMTISKATERQNVSFDTESFMAELLELVPELTTQIVELKNKFTKVTKTHVKSSFKVDLKNEGILDVSKNIWEKVKDMSSKFLSFIRSWGRGYDRKLNELKTQLGILENYNNYLNTLGI